MTPFLHSSPLLSFIDTGHCSVAQDSWELICQLQLTLAAPALPPESEAVISGTFCLALSGYGFLRERYQTDWETHLDPVEMSSVTHS